MGEAGESGRQRRTSERVKEGSESQNRGGGGGGGWGVEGRWWCREEAAEESLMGEKER